MNTASPTSSRHQLGGTLLGFVIGLLVGLGAALAVAVYVTRVPVPFVDRGLSRGAEADAQEAERNKGWNPNKGVGGGSAPAPAAAPAAPAEGTVSTPPADGKALPAPAESAAPAKAPASKDPLGDLVQQRLGQAPAKPPAPAPAEAPAPGADPFTYFVQAGAFRTAEDAEAQRAKLGMMGINAQVSEREQSGRTVYRVRVGPFNQKALAELTQEQLSSNGIESALVRVQR
ncbi:SPOR domain-containing protein [Hydrogenophaga sp.]|uniref:SPOR domain-containing protein n=1 Tax=Hydrogenophaga sp. TaxID=1904254 RepID=UPI0035AF2B7B